LGDEMLVARAETYHGFVRICHALVRSIQLTGQPIHNKPPSQPIGVIGFLALGALVNATIVR